MTVLSKAPKSPRKSKSEDAKQKESPETSCSFVDLLEAKYRMMKNQKMSAEK